jgi:hypothetical protein
MKRHCQNGPDCKYLNTPKGCKFAHGIQTEMVSRIYDEVRSALIQANMNPELSNVLVLHFFRTMSYTSLNSCIDTPEFLGNQMADTLDQMGLLV